MNQTKISNDQPPKAIGYIGVSQGKNNQPFEQFNKPETTNFNLNVPNDKHYSPQKPHPPYTQHNKQNESLSDVNSLETEDLEIKELTKLVAKARILEKKAELKKELDSIYYRLGENETKLQQKHDSGSLLNNTSQTENFTYSQSFKQKTLENCKLFSQIKM